MYKEKSVSNGLAYSCSNETATPTKALSCSLTLFCGRDAARKQMLQKHENTKITLLTGIPV